MVMERCINTSYVKCKQLEQRVFKLKMELIKPSCCVLLLLSTHFCPASSELKPLQGKVVSGLYYEESTQFVPYTKVVPLIFEFKLKTDIWKTVGANIFQILPRLNCRSDATAPALSTADWYFTCPVFYHLHQLLQAIKSNYTDVYPTSRNLSPSLGQDNQRFTNPHIKFDDCESIIQKIWKGTSREFGVAEYKGLIEKCNSVPVYVEEKIQDMSVDYVGNFDRMQSNFVSTFFLNSSDPGELINNLLSLQGIQLQSIYAELTRFREAVLSCQNQLIPQTFVKATRLEKAFLDLRPKLLQMRYAMSTQSINKLYKMPIADCIFGSSSLIVQILLPVVKADTTFSLLRVHSPIFLYGNRLCKIYPEQSSRIKTVFDDEPISRYYIYEKNSKLVVSTACTPGDRSLCYIPDQASRPLINRCMYSVLNNTFNTNAVRKYCSLQCEQNPLSDEFSKMIIPVIQRITTNKFVVVVNRITTLLIKCDGKQDEMVTPQEFGAVEIQLACGCFLMWHSEEYKARVPCTNTVTIRHVVPDHMLNRSKMDSGNKVFFVSNLGERINTSLISRTEMVDRMALKEIYEQVTTEAENDGENENDKGINSVSIVNNSGLTASEYNAFEACYTQLAHTFLWVAVGVETLLFLGIVLHLYCKIYKMNRKWELQDMRSVTYSSAAQITNIYE